MPESFSTTDLIFLSLKNQAISGNGAELTIAPAVDGRLAMVFYLFIEVTGAASSVTFQSGAGTAATAISGALPLQSVNDALELQTSNGYPILVADDTGEAITVANSGSTAATLAGFALYGHATRPSE